MNLKWTLYLILKKVMNIVFICYFDMWALFEPFMWPKKHFTFHSVPPQALEDMAQVSLAFFPNFTQNFMLIHCFENQSLISVTRHGNTHFISATTSTQLVLMHWNHSCCKLKHAQTYLYYDEIACLPWSHAIQSFWDIHSHTMYCNIDLFLS
jgi:hypothetical protein